MLCFKGILIFLSNKIIERLNRDIFFLILIKKNIRLIQRGIVFEILFVIKFNLFFIIGGLRKKLRRVIVKIIFLI
jgi:hypothetical protein